MMKKWIESLKQRLDYKARFERAVLDSSFTINELEQRLLMTESEREALKDGEVSKLSIQLNNSQIELCAMKARIIELESEGYFMELIGEIDTLISKNKTIEKLNENLQKDVRAVEAISDDFKHNYKALTEMKISGLRSQIRRQTEADLFLLSEQIKQRILNGEVIKRVTGRLRLSRPLFKEILKEKGTLQL